MARWSDHPSGRAGRTLAVTRGRRHARNRTGRSHAAATISDQQTRQPDVAKTAARGPKRPRRPCKDGGEGTPPPKKSRGTCESGGERTQPTSRGRGRRHGGGARISPPPKRPSVRRKGVDERTSPPNSSGVKCTGGGERTPISERTSRPLKHGGVNILSTKERLQEDPAAQEAERDVQR